MRLHAERGNVVLLYFWAPWCVTCRRDLPDIQAVHAARASVGLTVVGLSTDRRVAAVTAEYARSRGVTFPVAMAVDAHTRPYHLVGIPTTVLIDRHGRVRQILRGPVARVALMRAVDRLLAEHAGAVGVGRMSVPNDSA